MTPASTLSQTVPPRQTQALWCVLVCAAVVLPWINPFTFGPRPNSVQSLLTGLCSLALVQGYGVWGRRVDARTTQTLVFTAWLAAAVLASAMGLVQYFGEADRFAPWVSHAQVGEAYANLRQRNQFASLTSIGLASVLYLATRGRSLVLPWLPMLALLAMANATSASRTGALQWLMVAALTGVWSRPAQRQGVLLAGAAVLLYGVAVLAMPALLGAFTGIEHAGLMGRIHEASGCESRRVLWANVLELIAQKPWGGWGWGELKYAHFMHPYAGERFCAILDNAHNLPLQLAVELGLPVAASLGAAAVWLLWLSKPWRERAPSRQMAWAVLAIIGLHSLVEYPLWYGPFQMAVGACVWLLWPQYPKGPRTAWHTSVTLLVLALLALLLYAAWDYTRVSQIFLPPEQRLAVYRVNTLEKVRASRLFAREVQFADITTTALTAESASAQYATARQLLHFSPEPQVLKVLLSSAQLLGLDKGETQHVRARFQVAYPKDFAQWQASQASPQTP